MTKKELKKRIAERDDLTLDEVNRLFAEVQDSIDEALYEGDYEAVEEILMEELGIEPDYIYLFL